MDTLSAELERAGFKSVDFTGRRFGRLVVKGPNRPFKRPNQSTGISWICQCDCGVEKIISDRSFTKANPSQSCGCLQREVASANAKHGMNRDSGRHSIYGIWAAMIQRCLNPRARAYKWYGLRGIKVCDRWRHFDSFMEDMLPSWQAGLTLERNDVDGDYCPNNCRWATRKEQARNKRTSRRINIDGVEKNIADWAAVSGLDQKVIATRLKKGLQPRDAVFLPRQKKGGLRKILCSDDCTSRTIFNSMTDGVANFQPV